MTGQAAPGEPPVYFFPRDGYHRAFQAGQPVGRRLRMRKDGGMVTSMTADATRSLGRELIDTFGRGWQKGNIESLLSIFSDTATFIETPFADPIAGREAIKGYWKDIPA